MHKPTLNLANKTEKRNQFKSESILNVNIIIDYVIYYCNWGKKKKKEIQIQAFFFLLRV